MRAGYVLHSLECLERGVVGKCCSNVLRSLIAYGVKSKTVRRCVCEKSDTAHVRRSRCTLPYIQPRARSYTPMHMCMLTYQIETRVHALHVYLPTYLPVHNAIVYIMHKRTHSCEQAMYCTHLSVWSVELWASAAAMYCAPSSPMELFSRLYARMCV
jgi:hypothetical protein